MSKNFLVIRCDIRTLEDTLNESVNPNTHEIITISIESGNCVIVLKIISRRPMILEPYLVEEEVPRPMQPSDIGHGLAGVYSPYNPVELRNPQTPVTSTPQPHQDEKSLLAGLQAFMNNTTSPDSTTLPDG